MNVFTKLVCLMLVFIGLDVFFVVFRMVSLLNTSTLMVPLSYVLGLFFLFFLVYKRVRLSILEWFLSFYPILMIPVSIVKGNYLPYVISDSLKPILFFSFVAIVRHAYLNDTFFFDRIKAFLNFSAALSILSFLILFFTYLINPTFYPSFSDIGFVFYFYYYAFILKKNYYKFLFLFGIFLGGKLGVVLGFLLSFMFCLNFNRFFKVLFLTCILLVFLVSLPEIQFFTVFAKAEAILSLFDFSKNNLYEIFSKNDRLWELYQAYVAFENEIIWWILGDGPGFSYNYVNSDYYVENYHNVHFSPASLTFNYGFLYALLIYFYYFRVMLYGLSQNKNGSSSYLFYFALFVLSCLFFSLTAYVIFASLLLAFSIGVLSGHERNSRRSCSCS